jgi:hypothetical protein
MFLEDTIINLAQWLFTHTSKHINTTRALPCVLLQFLRYLFLLVHVHAASTPPHGRRPALLVHLAVISSVRILSAASVHLNMQARTRKHTTPLHCSLDKRKATVGTNNARIKYRLWFKSFLESLPSS